VLNRRSATSVAPSLVNTVASSQSKPKIAVLVSGNGSNLQALINARDAGTLDAEIVLVISNKSNAYALERAERAGIPNLCIPHRQYPSRAEFDAALVTELKKHHTQWVVFAGFMRLVTPILLDAYPERILNIHPSLLPAFPGTDAIQQALDYGAKLTGCTVHLVTAEMDSGPIVGQRAVVIRSDDTMETLSARVHAAEHKLLVASVQAAVTGKLTVESRGERRVVTVDSLDSP
jgi:phosphoribosylglycinamide formyltransferase-1